jgi:hypothetical protein
MIFFPSGTTAQRGVWPHSHTRFIDHKQRRATVDRTLLGRVISSSQRFLPENTRNRQHIHAHSEIRTHDRSKRAAVDLRLRPRSHLDRHHVTRHNTPIHNILSTAPQLGISQKSLGTLPKDGNVIPKHVGDTIHN